jgi:hypothetical protein
VSDIPIPQNVFGTDYAWIHSEAFVSDQNSNLSAIDLRNGRVLYSYKGGSSLRLFVRALN